MRTTLAMSLVVLASSAVWAKNPAPRAPAFKPGTGPIRTGEANKTPWGKTVDGLACRLLVCPEYCVGQPISAVVEVKNLSERTRHVVPLLSIQYKRRAKLTVTAPNGKPLRLSGWAETRIGKNSIRPLGPGETVRLDVPDLGSHYSRYVRNDRRFASQFSLPGKYTLRYTVTFQKFPKRIVVGERIRNGVREKMWHEFPAEVMKSAWSGTLVSGPAAFELTKITRADLSVHEWGVFTVFNGREYANANRKAEWGALPDFFYRQFPTQRLRWEPAVWDKPVIYFHSKRPCLRVSVRVTFPKGAPVVWWPCCAQPVDDGVRRSNQRPLFRSLVWNGWLGRTIPRVRQMGGRPAGPAWQEVADFGLPETCWLRQARLEDAMPITVAGSKLRRSAPWATSRSETERFIYYDGLVPSPDYLRCVAIGQKSVTLKNVAAFAIGPLFVVDNRGHGGVFARVASLGAGVTAEVKPQPVAGKWPAVGQAALHHALVKAGLYRPEAQTLGRIWQKGFFGRPGVTAFYLLPRAEYDRMIKLEIHPNPAEVVRVGVALHSHLDVEPTLAKKARARIAELDDPDPGTRERATKALTELGPLAYRLVEEALKDPTASFERKARCREILRHGDATEYLRRADKRPKTPGRR